jgi:uncharacterized membrane protein YfhO
MGNRLKAGNEKREPLIRRLFGENKYIFMAFVFSGVVMFFVYYCFGLFPFGDVTILRMDLYHQYGPLFAELYERIVGLKSFLYSWNTGLGSSFIGNFFNYLSSPLSLIVVFFGHKNIPEAVAALILIKGAFASASFAYYLKRSQGQNDFTITAFGLLYSFCGFFIAYYWNVMWLDAMVLFPLAMLGIELIIKNKKFGLYVFALTMTMLTNYYMAYMLCIFSVLFYLVSYFGSYSFTSCYDTLHAGDHPEIDSKPSFWSRIRHSRFLGSGFIFAFSALMSVALAAAALIPVYYILQGSSATADSFPATFKSYYKIFDFLANHLASVEPTIRSSGTDVLPNIYSGLATIILVPLFLFTKSISIKEKAAYVGLLGFLYFSFNLNYTNFIWHAFHFPNDLPYRFSFMYSFILLIISYKAFVRLKEFTAKEVLGAGIAVVFAIVLIQEIGSKNITDISVIISLSFIVLYTMLFAMHSRDKFPSAAFALLILCSFTAEACIANTDKYSMSQTKTNYAQDLPDFQLLKEKLDEYDNEDFYRMELTSLRTRMDPSWYDYNGVSTFSSMAYEKVSNLQSKLGMAGNYINSYTYNSQTPVYNAMHSLKYIVNNSNGISMNPIFYEALFSKDKFTAYENRYHLPIAYCADDSVLNWDYNSSNPFDVQGDYFTKATGMETPFSQIPITDAEYMNVDEIFYGFDTGEFYFYRTNPGSDATVTFILTPVESQSCYIYMKSSHVDNVVVSSGDYILRHNDDRGAIIDIGIHEAGEQIRVELPISEGDSGNISLYAYSLDTAKFAEGYNKLYSGRLNVTKFEETNIVGTLYAPGNSILYTSIPYDEGWTVTINGEKLPTAELLKVGDAMLAVPLDKEGSNTVEFKFVPKGLYLGLYISAVALLALILLLIVRKIFRRLDEKHAPYMLPAAEMTAIPPIEPGTYSYLDFGLETYEPPQASPKQETWPRDTQEESPPEQDTAAVAARVIIEEDLDLIVEKIDEE